MQIEDTQFFFLIFLIFPVSFVGIAPEDKEPFEIVSGEGLG